MKTKVLSPEEYEALSRADKRAMDRAREKQGLAPLEIYPRIKWFVDVEKTLLTAGLHILDKNQMTPGQFMDLCFQNLLMSSDIEK